MNTDRRRFLAAAVKAAPVAVLAIAGAPALAGACYDPETLPMSQKSRRRSLSYVEAAADPARRCQGCTFFTASEPGCGKCQLLGAAVNAGASCASFAARPK